MTIEQIASAVYNDVMSAFVGANSNPVIDQEQLEDEVVAERERVILEWWKKNILQKGDLLTAINCVVVDCKDSVKCCNNAAGYSEKHFEIPQILFIGLGLLIENNNILYIILQIKQNIINIRKEEQINPTFILRELQMKMECMMVEFLIYHM